MLPGSRYHYPKSQRFLNASTFSQHEINRLLHPQTSHDVFDACTSCSSQGDQLPPTLPDIPEGLLEFASFASTLKAENYALFATAMERPPAFWNHATSNSEHDALPPPYGFGHIIGPPLKEDLPTVTKVRWNDHVTQSGFHNQKKDTLNSKRCAFAVDTMCSPYSVISEAMVKDLNLRTIQRTVQTTLADPESKYISSQIAEFELMIYWNAKRRTFKITAMVWPNLPAKQDLII